MWIEENYANFLTKSRNLAPKWGEGSGYELGFPGLSGQDYAIYFWSLNSENEFTIKF